MNQNNILSDYQNYLRNIKGYSPNTVESYLKDIRDFQIWARTNLTDARWSTIDRNTIDRYISDLANQGYRPTTTNRRLSSISSLYRYFLRQGYKVENPCQYESRRKIGINIPNTIPAKDIADAYNYANGIAKVAIGLLATTGIRIQELLDLHLEDIDFNTCAIKIKGKGNKERIVYTTADKLTTLKAVHDYIKPTGQIFTIGQREMRRIIFNALRPFSQAKQLSPHAIRHTFATIAANRGCNTSTLAKVLGHERIETTQRYIDLNTAPVQATCQLMNPLT